MAAGVAVVVFVILPAIFYVRSIALHTLVAEYKLYDAEEWKMV